MERFLEGLVEGIFGREANNLPAGILRHLAAEIEREAIVKGGRRWAPPDCHILLTREAMRLVLPIREQLEEELRSALARFAVQVGLSFPSPLRFKFAVGDGAGVAVLSARAAFPLPPPDESQETTIGGSETSPTKVYRRPGDPQEHAWLRVGSGPEAGREFQLVQGKMVIGRHASNHVVLGDPNVSRRHAAVVYERGGYNLVDLGSTNGTFVNDKAATRHRLRNGDRIRLGQTDIVFHSHRAHS